MNIKSDLETRVEITLDYLERMIRHRKEYMQDLQDMLSNPRSANYVNHSLEMRVAQLNQEIISMEFTIKSLKGEF